MSHISSAVNIKECATSSNLSVLCLYAHRWALGDTKPSTAKCTEMLCSFLKFHPASESVYLTFFSPLLPFLSQRIAPTVRKKCTKMQTSKIRSWVTLNVSFSIARCEKNKWFETAICFKNNIIWYFQAIWWFNEHRWMWDEFLGDKCLMYLLRFFQD